jgi:hypothetical protein
MSSPHPLLYISLTLNVLVLAPLILLLLVFKPERMEKVYGDDTDARKILAAVYFAIMVGSIWAMALGGEDAIDMALPILYLQIIYKLITVLTVGLKNPVVISNVFIAILHIVSVYVLVTTREDETNI